jgi:hypothetical protein
MVPLVCTGRKIMFNTLRYAKMLQEVGFSKDQAEKSIEILSEIMEDKLATKEDLQLLKSDLTIRMGMMLAASVTIIAALVKIL